MSEYIVNFGKDKSSMFVRLSMAEAASHGAKIQELIVRCRDCTHAVLWDATKADSMIDCDLIDKAVKPSHFCAWGERKIEQ